LLVVLLAAVGAACQNSGSSNPPHPDSSDPRPSRLGPFVEDDSSGVILDARWVDPTGKTPALQTPIAEGEPEAVLMGTSEPDILRIAVNGNGCVPEATISVLDDPPALELSIVLGEAVPDPDLQCADLLTTHAFEVWLSEPVDIGEVSLVVDHSSPS